MQTQTIQEKDNAIAQELENQVEYLKVNLELVEQSIKEYRNDPTGQSCGGWSIPVHGLIVHGQSMVKTAKTIQSLRQKENNRLFKWMKKVRNTKYD